MPKGQRDVIQAKTPVACFAAGEGTAMRRQSDCLGRRTVTRSEAFSMPLTECGSPGGQIEQVPGFERLRLSVGRECHPAFQTMHDDLTFGLMLRDFFPRRDDQADNLHLLGTNQGLRLRRGQRRPQGPNVHDLVGLGVRNSHRRFLLSSGVEGTPVSAILGRFQPGRPRRSTGSTAARGFVGSAGE